MNDFVSLVIPVLQLLASSAQEQIRYLEKLGTNGNADELALEYDDLMLSAEHNLNEGVITKKQYEHMWELNRKLDEMSGPDKANLWTEKALSDSSKWAEVRELAIKCLSAFD